MNERSTVQLRFDGQLPIPAPCAERAVFADRIISRRLAIKPALSCGRASALRHFTRFGINIAATSYVPRELLAQRGAYSLTYTPFRSNRQLSLPHPVNHCHHGIYPHFDTNAGRRSSMASVRGEINIRTQSLQRRTAIAQPGVAGHLGAAEPAADLEILMPWAPWRMACRSAFHGAPVADAALEAWSAMLWAHEKGIAVGGLDLLDVQVDLLCRSALPCSPPDLLNAPRPCGRSKCRASPCKTATLRLAQDNARHRIRETPARPASARIRSRMAKS